VWKSKVKRIFQLLTSCTNPFTRQGFKDVVGEFGKPNPPAPFPPLPNPPLVGEGKGKTFLAGRGSLEAPPRFGEPEL